MSAGCRQTGADRVFAGIDGMGVQRFSAWRALSMSPCAPDGRRRVGIGRRASFGAQQGARFKAGQQCLSGQAGLPSGIFEGPTVERLDERLDNGEVRVYAIGLMNGVEVTVIYVDRENDERQLISAWRAEPHERRYFWRHVED
jgi:hypothetical protein